MTGLNRSATLLLGQIRPYTLHDRDAVERLNKRYYEDEHGFDASFSRAMSGALDQIGLAIQSTTGIGWVLIDNNEVAGSLFLTPERRGTGRIRLFFVRSDLQGRGLGAALMAQCLQAATPLWFQTILVSTFTVHDAACALYLKSGFVQAQRSDCRVFGRDLMQVDFVRSNADG
ncbi:GNAT family N-acetyltransferase [Jannaschia sp. CCS1]|uniref:GNAT family N-acetyltransferase n=1 Tax=Jannaschia sp. (strain CCS1) TaxID=290400 RepID=UPI000053DB79|nr:GNAT family N-acetyltransferase [Jannaschia sp. CCS1]ABD56718.1 GCN5-related N-acetyltransferase [Jannaschia sp. CCS1]